MQIQERIIAFITRANWLILAAVVLLGWAMASPAMARGLTAGGLLVTINFHLMARTLRRSLAPPHLASMNSVLAKYYLRFIASGVIIFALIVTGWVHPIGLVIGLSIVVASVMLAAGREIKFLLVKEAV